MGDGGTKMDGIHHRNHRVIVTITITVKITPLLSFGCLSKLVYRKLGNSVWKS